jgi:hypothetical protein
MHTDKQYHYARSTKTERTLKALRSHNHRKVLNWQPSGAQTDPGLTYDHNSPAFKAIAAEYETKART